jgi:hypothetical protein
MNLSGKINMILPEMKGEGKNGPWSRQDFILETDDQYPKKVCISVWNNKVRLSEFKPGDVITVEISVESREYNGRWYTDVKASSVVANKNAQQPPEEKGPAPWDEPAGDSAAPGDDLPF